MNELTTSESNRFSKLETTIKQTQGAFIACGNALMEIRDSRLYRDKYSTFAEYCEKRWGWTRRHADQLITSAKLVLELKNENDRSQNENDRSQNIGRALQNEWQVRALVNVAPENRLRVLKAAIKAGNVTAAGITEAAQQDTNSEEPIIAVDKTGYPVPESSMIYWMRSVEVEEILLHISRARSRAKELQDSKDPMYCEVNMNSVYADLCNAYNSFKLALPHAVCPVCQGQTADTCTLCGGRGLISKFRFETAVPEELKTIRNKTIKKFASKTLGKKSTEIPINT